MIVFHPYSTDPSHGERQKETRDRLHELQANLGPEVRFIHHPCSQGRRDRGEDSDYERGLKGLWGLDEILVVEHDIVPDLAMVQRMMTCTCSHLCSQSYHLVADWLHDPAVVQALDMLEELYQRGQVVPKLWRLHLGVYRRYRAGGGDVIFAHRLDGGTEADEFIRDGMEWADYTGFGLARIGLEFQREHAPGWEPGPWNDLDTRFSEWTFRLGYKWHVHWPTVRHNHVA